LRTALVEPSVGALRLAGAILRSGGLVAFPTETVYGLGASALDAGAMAEVYAVKGRAADNPLIVHVGSISEAGALGRVSTVARALAERFWPGPLTLVLPRWRGEGTVAVRCPDHPVAQTLIALARRPLAAPSANLSGRPSPTLAEHVMAELGGEIPLILDGGPTGYGVESTVLDVTSTPLRILRPGGVSQELLAKEGFDVSVQPLRPDEMPRSPGQKYRHYAPSVPMVAVGPGAGGIETIRAWAEKIQEAGRRPGVIAIGEAAGPWPGSIFPDERAMAGGLFGAMRELEAKVDVILALMPPEEGIGRAIANRLEKASAGRIYPPGHPLPDIPRGEDRS